MTDMSAAAVLELLGRRMLRGKRQALRVARTTWRWPMLSVPHPSLVYVARVNQTIEVKSRLARNLIDPWTPASPEGSGVSASSKQLGAGMGGRQAGCYSILFQETDACRAQTPIDPMTWKGQHTHAHCRFPQHGR